jgi:hypothetical protein
MIEGILLKASIRYLELELGDGDKKQKTKAINYVFNLAEKETKKPIPDPDIIHPATYFNIPLETWNNPHIPNRINTNMAMQYTAHIIEILERRKEGGLYGG